jgi:hypothetical protein
MSREARRQVAEEVELLAGNSQGEVSLMGRIKALVLDHSKP